MQERTGRPSHPTHSHLLTLHPLSPTLILRLENKPPQRTRTNSHTHKHMHREKHIHTHIQTLPLIHIETHTLNTHTPTNIHAEKHSYTQTLIYTNTNTQTIIHTETHTLIHTQTLIHTNTNTHLYTQKHTLIHTQMLHTQGSGVSSCCEDHMEKEGQGKKEVKREKQGRHGTKHLFRSTACLAFASETRTQL